MDGKLVVLVLMLVSTSARFSKHDEGEEEEDDIYIEFDSYKLQLGTDADFHCINLQFLPVHWINPNGTDINALNDPRLGYNGTTGVLHIEAASFEDIGNYTCVAGLVSASVDIFVYKMPDYRMEGYIMMGVNGGLLLLFAGCLLYSYLSVRRLKRGYEEAGFLKAQEGGLNLKGGLAAGF